MINVMVRRKMEYRMNNNRIRSSLLAASEWRSIPIVRKNAEMQRRVQEYVVCDSDTDRQGAGTDRMY